MQRLASEAVALNNEKRELLNAVRALSGIIEETHLLSATQNSRIEEIDDEIATRSAELSTRIERKFKEIQELIKYEDEVLYNDALQDFSERNYLAAEKNFDELLLRYPDSLYAHAALFWLASIQIEQNYHDVAKETLMQLLAKYPNSPRIPDAIILLEEIAIIENDQLAAQHWLDLLLDRYPVSPAADRRRFEIAQSSN